MPFDQVAPVAQFPALTPATVFGEIPADIDFKLDFEWANTRAREKVVINRDTGERLRTVGGTFNAKPHGELFRALQEELIANTPPSDLRDVTCRYDTGRFGGYASFDATFPSISKQITTSKHQTDVAMRLIGWHGVDGLTSNNFCFGAIDFFCHNGMRSGEYTEVRRKNTAGFTIDSFVDELGKAKDAFFEEMAYFQRLANKDLLNFDVQRLVDATCTLGEAGKKKMSELVAQEISVRGSNMWAVYSAYTNYASYADERNGFKFRSTVEANDNVAPQLAARETQVKGWTSSPAWNQCLLAA